MAAKKYMFCRVTEDTYKRLSSVMAELKRKARRKPEGYLPGLSTGKVGMSDVIDQLIFALDKEATRKRSYANRRRSPTKVILRKPGPTEVARMVDEGCPNAD